MHARTLVAVAVAAMLLGAALPLMSGTGTAEATIDDIMSGECNNAASEDALDTHRNTGVGAFGLDEIQHPPGLTKFDPTGEPVGPFAQPLFATGVVIGFAAEGEPIIDETNPALNGNSGVEHCPGAD